MLKMLSISKKILSEKLSKKFKFIFSRVAIEKFMTSAAFCKDLAIVKTAIIAQRLKFSTSTIWQCAVLYQSAFEYHQKMWYFSDCTQKNYCNSICLELNMRYKIIF